MRDYAIFIIGLKLIDPRDILITQLREMCLLTYETLLYVQGLVAQDMHTVSAITMYYFRDLVYLWLMRKKSHPLCNCILIGWHCQTDSGLELKINSAFRLGFTLTL